MSRGMLHASKLLLGEEHYLKALLHLQKGEQLVSPTEFADYLEVAPSTVTAMLKQLDKKELAAYFPYRGARLTQSGRTTALSLERRFRLAERLLADVIGMPWELVHDEACLLEHVMSPQLEQRLMVLLNNPQTCPHGHPLPNANGEIPSEPLMTLSELAPGTRATVAMLGEDPNVLWVLGRARILPETDLTLEHRDDAGICHVLIGDARQTLPLRPAIASQIWVRV